MNKFKIKDFFFAGIMAGVSNGLIYNLYIFILQRFRLVGRSPWVDASAIFFKPPEVYTLPAQIFGFMMSLNAPIFISISLCLLVKLTGKDYVYIKSIAVAELTTFFSFLFYPAVGLSYINHALDTIYSAFFGMFLFGIFLGYFVKKYTDFGSHW